MCSSFPNDTAVKYRLSTVLDILHKHVSAIGLKGKMGSDIAGALKAIFSRQCTSQITD